VAQVETTSEDFPAAMSEMAWLRKLHLREAKMWQISN
jgi:hypothetical protein